MPLSFLLIPYALCVAGVVAYGLLTTWSLYRYGGEFSAYAATVLFWAGTASVLFFSWIALAPVDWTQPLFDLSSFTTVSL